MSAERVWDSVRDMFYSSDNVAVHGLTCGQVQYFGGSIHGLVEVPSLSMVLGRAMGYFQFHRVYADKGPNGTKVELDPATVICDFEPRSIKAVLTQFPNARVSGCFFHFKQA
ncbi:Hypothetical protein PHPALM_7820 [Phytophthora palmivora]|uniref:MULE transposase domain-containing protein n=1 Tax=Phytophthora palmivora TaxID=4796 RepID=A0A2P4YBD8_9STRA|nr:Hypothetical protein PHPALM_7820 [Phytophthora palmivora]